MIILILFFTLSIGFSFLCSILEAVLLSITPAFIRNKVAEGSAMGKQLEEYKEDIDKPLSAILTLNTLAHTVGAIGVGATAGTLFGENQIVLGPIHLSYESLIAGGMTLAILILSEIIPKTIGANNWRSLAPFALKTIKFLMFILFPFVWISKLITNRLKKDETMSVLKRSDLLAMTTEVEKSGTLDKNESKVIKNMLKLQALTVRDIMTPRSVMFMANEKDGLKEFFDKNHPIQFSRIPIYEDKDRDITGFILKDDLLQAIINEKNIEKLEDIKRPVLMVDSNTPLLKMFDKFSKNKAHLAIVVDEFGTVGGLVTMEDLFETILGEEIVDEFDRVEDMQKYARQKWEERAKKLDIKE